MPNETVHVEEVDADKKAAKINGEWHPIVGKAAQYIKYLKPGGADAEIKEDGSIPYIRNTGSKGSSSSGSSNSTNTPDRPSKDAAITAMWAIREAIQFNRLWAELGGGSLLHTKETTTAQYRWTNLKELQEDILNTADSLITAVEQRDEASR